MQLSGDCECGLRAGEVPAVETRARMSGREKERRGREGNEERGRSEGELKGRDGRAGWERGFEV